MCEEILQENDYDPGLINDYGGGNVQWWQDYIRYEVNMANEYWRSIVESHLNNGDALEPKKSCTINHSDMIRIGKHYCPECKKTLVK